MALQPDIHANQSILVYIDSEDAEADYQSGDLSGVSADFILDIVPPIPSNSSSGWATTIKIFLFLKIFFIPYSFLK